MYFSAKQYPVLSEMSKREKMKVIRSAIRKEGGWMTKRFWLFLIIMFASIALATKFGFILLLGKWGGVIVSVAFGTLFYAYLLWEINGEIYAAVMRHIEKHEIT